MYACAYMTYAQVQAMTTFVETLTDAAHTSIQLVCKRERDSEGQDVRQDIYPSEYPDPVTGWLWIRLYRTDSITLGTLEKGGKSART